MNDGSPRRPPRLRGWLAAAATLLLLAGVAGFRTLRPAEVHQVARQPYPQGPGPSSRMPGRMPNLPLIVDGVLRVFAEPYQVRADAPLSRRYPTSPFWSLRRWPQQLLGVAAVGRLVLTRWSDGVLLALDAPTGAVAWRLAGPPPAAGAGHDDRATGARTVRAPEGLHTAGDVVAVAGGREFVAVDGRGAVRWRRPLPECLRSTFGTADARLVHVAGCAAPRLLFVDARTGADAGAWAPGGAGADAAVEPLGCGPAVSDCHGMRVRAGGRAAGYLLAGARPVAAPALADPAALLVPRPGAAPLAVRVADGAVVAAHARDGAPAWRWRPARALI
ncbi:MAG TPA: PQQ-binding-like beta-propeller repeat protein, partial [Pilimelia sp.]|nr:PQQ-binding-like beta-propeller repeat protein [Pilimelia sp.]